MSGWRVGLLYDLKQSIQVDADAPSDALAEYDSFETVQGIEDALLAGQNEVIPMEGDHTLLDTLRAHMPDICFNICEGRRGDARESQAPALLEFLGIPYTGSKILGHALSLDKAMAKRVVAASGLPTPPFAVVAHPDDLEHLAADIETDGALQFPLFAKPLAQGTAMGIDEASVLEDTGALRERGRSLLARYRQPVLIEAYLPGREFTVGVLGTGPTAEVLGTTEIRLAERAEKGVYSFVNKERCESLVVYEPVPASGLRDEVEAVAFAAYRALDCRDGGRVDLRCDAQGAPQFMEANPLAGLHPTHSDLPIIASQRGVSYDDLLTRILHSAAARYGLD